MRHGAQIVITDLKSEAELKESVEEITKWYSQYKNTYTDRNIYQPIFVLGEHHEDDFTNVDLVMQNPGVPRESTFVLLAKEHQIHVESDISLFFRYCPFPIYSVTGTRGKSTTTALLGEMLRTLHPKTVIAGNITRSPLEDLDWLLEEKLPVPIVLELSSWLLESLEGLNRGPQIAVLTNAYQDHLDRYDSFEHYVRAKELIFKQQRPDHIAGVKDEDIHETLKTFVGLPGRQQIIAEVDGVMYVNDTTGTSPEGVIVALQRFGNGQNIVLIAGGASKGLKFDEMAESIGKSCKQVVLFEGSAFEDIARAIGDKTPMVRADSMRTAVRAAQSVAKLGDVVLLSPGTSSFGIFKNEFDRGDQFNAMVK